MIITKVGKELTIDGRGKTTINLKKYEEKLEFIGFDDFNIRVNNFNFITHNEKYYFGQDIKIGNRLYKYIGIDNTKKKETHILWDVNKECIYLGGV